MKLWGKIIINNKLYMHDVSDDIDTKDYMLLADKTLEDLCKKLDISIPYWLDKNKSEYLKRMKTAFTADNFIEGIDFDKFEIEVIGDE